jgi:hypothetical protein
MGGFLSGTNTALKELTFQSNDEIDVLSTERWATPSAMKVLAAWRIIRPNNVIAQPVQCGVCAMSGSAKATDPGDGLRFGMISSPDGINWTLEADLNYFGDTYLPDQIAFDFGGVDLLDPTMDYVGFGGGMDSGPAAGGTIQQIDMYLSLLLPKGHVLVRVV